MSEIRHEIEIIKAIEHILSSDLNCNLVLNGIPDEEDNSEETVDARYKYSDSIVYIEHTKLENYPGQYYDDIVFLETLPVLRKKLSDKLPGKWSYALDVKLNELHKIKNRSNMQEQLLSWILNKTQEFIEIEQPKSILKLGEFKFTGVIFSLTRRLHGNLGNIIFGRYDFKDELKIKFQTDRLKIALEKKCPKLQKAKRNSSDSTILVFECENDVFDSTPDIYSIFQELSKEYEKQLPDYVYIIQNYDRFKEYYLWKLKIRDCILPFNTKFETTIPKINNG